MRARVATLLGADPRGLWIGTFHSLSARLLRREAPLLGFGPNFTIYDQDDSEALIKRLLEQRGLPPRQSFQRPTERAVAAALGGPPPPASHAGDVEATRCRPHPARGPLGGSMLNRTLIYSLAVVAGGLAAGNAFAIGVTTSGTQTALPITRPAASAYTLTLYAATGGAPPNF